MICPVELANEVSAFGGLGWCFLWAHAARPSTAVERATKLQEVITRAMAKEISWYQAAESSYATEIECQGTGGENG